MNGTPWSRQTWRTTRARSSSGRASSCLSRSWTTSTPPAMHAARKAREVGPVGRAEVETPSRRGHQPPATARTSSSRSPGRARSSPASARGRRARRCARPAPTWRPGRAAAAGRRRSHPSGTSSASPLDTTCMARRYLRSMTATVEFAHVRRSFGTVTALADLTLSVPGRIGHRAGRAQRRRQDHRPARHHRRPGARGGHGPGLRARPGRRRRRAGPPPLRRGGGQARPLRPPHRPRQPPLRGRAVRPRGRRGAGRGRRRPLRHRRCRSTCRSAATRRA